MEDILAFILECLVQILFEALVEALGHKFTFLRPKPDVVNERQVSRNLGYLKYICLGIVAGFVSVQLVPHGFIHAPVLQIANLIITPIISAYVMVNIGAIRKHKGQPLIGIDSFPYAYVFALCMALTRFGLAS